MVGIVKSQLGRNPLYRQHGAVQHLSGTIDPKVQGILVSVPGIAKREDDIVRRNGPRHWSYDRLSRWQTVRRAEIFTRRERLLCESSGAGGYEMALREFKPLEDFLLAAGVNVMTPHLSYQTLAGARKYDWPQTISDHSSWWDSYRLQADHVGRVAYTLPQGHERNRVLVLHPCTTGWMRYHHKDFLLDDKSEANPMKEIGTAQQQFLAAKHADHWKTFPTVNQLVAELRATVPPRIGRPDGSSLPTGLCWRRHERSDGTIIYFFCYPWKGTGDSHRCVRMTSDGNRSVRAGAGNHGRSAPGRVPSPDRVPAC